MNQMIILGFAWILSLVMGGAVAAQDQPNFSGRWILVSSTVADPGAARSLSIRQPVKTTNALGAPIAPYFLDLIVEREYADRVTTETHTIGVGGGLVGGVAGGGVSYKSTFSVRWEGDSLVMERWSYPNEAPDAQPSSVHREEWHLDSRGMLVVSVTDRSSDSEPKSNTFTYRRN
jgi:hypothetical protein